MNKKILILLLSIVPIASFAQKDFKLVEQSQKEKPNWIYSNSVGTYMIQANKVATIEEAQNMVMSSLLEKICSSVAVVVTSETEKSVDWTVIDNKDSYMENIKTNTTLKIAKMPALQGVSISKAEVYWEKYINKKTKEIFYDYYILYPFSQFELQELIDEYNAIEKALNDKIDSFRNSLPTINDVDLLLENISDMKVMTNEIGKDDHRYAKLKNNISLYEKTIDELYIDILYNGDGRIIFQLRYDDKVMRSKSLPQLRSECARDFSKKHDGDKVELKFNTFDCYEQDDNYVEIRYTFGKKKLIKKVNIKL